MRTSEVEFSFPVLGFTPDVDAWVFKDRKMLTTCGPDTLKKQMQVGMELVDADGRRWRVTSVRALGPIRPLWLWLIHLLALKPQTRIDQELEPLDPLSLDEIKARVCACYEKPIATGTRPRTKRTISANSSRCSNRCAPPAASRRSMNARGWTASTRIESVGLKARDLALGGLID